MRVVNVFVIDTHKGPALHPRNSPGNGPALRDPRQAQAGGRGTRGRPPRNRAAVQGLPADGARIHAFTRTALSPRPPEAVGVILGKPQKEEGLNPGWTRAH